MAIVSLFLQQAARYSDKPAIVSGGQTMTFAEVAAEAARMSALLGDMGVAPGDCLLVALDNGIPFTLLMLAAADRAVMLAPVNPTLPVVAMHQAVEAASASVIVGNSRVCRRLAGAGKERSALPMLVVGSAIEGCRNVAELDELNDVPALGCREVDPDTPFLLTMTSGSTGDPKPITLSQGCKIRRALDGARDLYGLDADDVIVTATPMYHSLGFRLALLPLLIGATSVILMRFNPAIWIAAVQRHQVSFAIMISSQLETLCEQLEGSADRLESLRVLVSSSALLRPSIKRRCLDVFDCIFHECYGASEVGIVTNLRVGRGDTPSGSVGRALDFVDVKILDDEGREKATGEVGEIVCQTSTMFSGYFRRSEETGVAFSGDYFRTGDTGRVDEDGYLYLSGRKKDIIIVGGTNVYPDDVEAVIARAPGVRECAVIGVPDAHFGEAILAVVVAQSDAVDIRRLRGYCAEHLADYQQPQAFERVADLPRTALGKVQRQRLRDRFRDYDATADLRRFMAASR